MKQPTVKLLLIALFCILATCLLADPPARSASRTTRIALTPDAVGERVDCLIAFLRQNADLRIPGDFEAVSGLKSELSQIGEPGLVVEAENAEGALSKAVKEVLEKLLEQLSADSPYRDIVTALLENLDELPEGFCEPEAYETETGLLVTGHDLHDDREHYKDPPNEPGNSFFYGKKCALPDEESAPPNGILFISDNPSIYSRTASDGTSSEVGYPPAISPLWIVSHDGGSASFNPTEGNSFPPIDQVFDPPRITGTDDFFRYAYNTAENAPTAPFSATVYTNPVDNRSDWILFSYGNVQLPYDRYEAFVGLEPGDGSKNHPGPGRPRDMVSLDLSAESGASIHNVSMDYLWIYETFENNDASQDDGFDLGDHFLIFRPDGNNKYAVTAGTREMVVDSLGLDDENTSLDMTFRNLRNKDLLARVDGNAYQPGIYFWGKPDPNAQFPGIENWPILWGDPDNQYYYYRYGVQTVGQNSKWGDPQLFIDWNALNSINGNGLLAYAVQGEEDRVNKKIIEMARDADALKLQVETIKNQLKCDDIRARDALFAQQADAQSGRVTRDRNGNWVRAQQYILRPDNKTVQVLNVSLRGQDAGDLAGLSTMDFTTTLKQQYQGDLRDLPWSGWLGTQTDGIVKWVNTGYSGPDLDRMYVKFTNPSGEYLKESRWFGEKTYDESLQYIMGEELALTSLKNGNHVYGYHYTDALSNPELYPKHKVLLPEGSYSLEDNQGAGFSYTFAGDSRINVTFFKLDDFGNGPTEPADFTDIWDALRVNEGGNSPGIGNNNLEIAIDKDMNSFDKPVDVVYIPMSRMLWKTRE